MEGWIEEWAVEEWADANWYWHSKTKSTANVILYEDNGRRAGNSRINQRRASQVNERVLRQITVRTVNFKLYWDTYVFWVRRIMESQATIYVTPRFEVIRNGDRRGSFICVKLAIASDLIPSWFPALDQLPSKDSNFLHISISFTGDIRQMTEKSDRDMATRYIKALVNDPQWNGQTQHATTICSMLKHGTFHLSGFDSDYRMRWLHERGSYSHKKFGHIALYRGGLHQI